MMKNLKHKIKLALCAILVMPAIALAALARSLTEGQVDVPPLPNAPSAKEMELINWALQQRAPSEDADWN
ncbi:MAG: hypothetical protein V3W44_09780 [Dehalococcoidales bacterium]